MEKQHKLNESVWKKEETVGGNIYIYIERDRKWKNWERQTEGDLYRERERDGEIDILKEIGR